MSAEMTTVAASSTSDPLPVKRQSRTASAWRRTGRGFGARAHGRGASPGDRCRGRPEDGRGKRVEGRSSKQHVLRARQGRRPQLRVVPNAPEAPTQQRREHRREVRRLEARPGLVEDPPALALIANGADRWVARRLGGLHEEDGRDGEARASHAYFQVLRFPSWFTERKSPAVFSGVVTARGPRLDRHGAV